VVRNHDLDSLYGRYLFADFCALSGDIRSLALAKPTATDTGSTGMAMRSIYSFGEDSCGHIYIGSASGEVDVLLDDPARFTPCPEPPPPPPKPKDRTPPALTVAHAASEEIADRRYVQVKLACDERCGTVTSGTLVLPHAGRTFDLTGASRQLGAGTPVRLRLFFTRDAAAAARRTIANGYTAWAFLKVTARDAAGNQTVRRLRMQLVD
jgi:hypothetical protein